MKCSVSREYRNTEEVEHRRHIPGDRRGLGNGTVHLCGLRASSLSLNPDAGQRSRCGTCERLGILDAKIVIDGMMKFLLASEVALRRLNRCVAEQKLYLL